MREYIYSAEQTTSQMYTSDVVTPPKPITVNYGYKGYFTPNVDGVTVLIQTEKTLIPHPNAKGTRFARATGACIYFLFIIIILAVVILVILAIA